jgi:hypothetical protein
MKTVKCDLCDVTADGETFEEWMAALRHDPSHTEEDRKRWMADNRARFDAA